MAQTQEPIGKHVINKADEGVKQRVHTLEDPCFLVNMINKVEIELLAELLDKNDVRFVIRNASRRNQKRPHTGFALLGKDVFVERAQFAQAKVALQDYSLGSEQATAAVDQVPAARRQSAFTQNRRHHSLKKLIALLLLATVGYLVIFIIGMQLMKH